MITLNTLAMAGTRDSEIHVLEARDPYTGATGLGSFLEERGVGFTRVRASVTWSPGQCKLLVIGSFASSSARVRSWLKRNSRLVRSFVESGGTVIELAQASKDEPCVEWLPEGMDLCRGRRDADVVVLAGQDAETAGKILGLDGPGLSALAVGDIGYDASRDVGPGLDSFASASGLEVLVTDRSGRPLAVAGSYGRGRLLIAQFAPDKVYDLPRSVTAAGAAVSMLHSVLKWGLEGGLESIVSNSFSIEEHVKIHGRVLVDSNSNGIADQGDRPAAGVEVGLGFDYTRTDSDGAFEFDMKHDGVSYLQVLSVPWACRGRPILVRGWKPGKRDVNLLLACDENAHGKGRVVFGVLSDTHILPASARSEADLADLTGLLSRVKRLGADFAVIIGDTTSTASPSELGSVGRVLKSARLPVFLLPGNHDLTRGPDELDRYKEYAGPEVTSFLVGDALVFMGLDLLGEPKSRQWLERRMSEDAPDSKVIILQHYPPPAGFKGSIGGRNVNLVVHGHVHAAASCSVGSCKVVSVPPALFGGLDRSPAGFAMVEVGPEGIGVEVLENRVRAYGKPKEGFEIGNERRPVWRTKTPVSRVVSAPLVSGGRVYLAGADEEGCKGRIVSLDFECGRVLWTKALSGFGTAISASRGKLLVREGNGAIDILAAEDGRVLRRLDPSTLFPGPRWLPDCPLVLSKAYMTGTSQPLVVSASAKMPLAWGMSKGVAWMAKRLEGFSLPSFTGGCIGPGPKLFLSSSSAGLVALDARSGNVLWKAPRPFAATGPPAVCGGEVIVCTGSSVLGFDQETGEKHWSARLPFSMHTARPVCAGKVVLIQAGQGSLIAFSPEDGALLWSSPSLPGLLRVGPYRRRGPSSGAAPSVYQDLVVQAGDDGVLRFLEIESGRLRSKVFVGSPVAGTAVSSGGVVAVTIDGEASLWSWPD